MAASGTFPIDKYHSNPTVSQRQNRDRFERIMKRRRKGSDEIIFAPPIEIDFNNLDLLRQVGSLCWAESSMVALFLAPAVRDYVWSKIFKIQSFEKIVEATGKKKLVMVPVRTIYPTFNNYDIEYLKFVARGFAIKYKNYDELIELFRALSTFLFIIVEKIRHILYNYITQEGGEKVYRKCESQLQRIVCTGKFPELSKIIGCESIEGGGFYENFTNILKYGYNLNCLTIRSIKEDEELPIFPVESPIEFSMIAGYTLFKEETETKLGHVVSYFTDSDSVQGVISYDNIATDGTTFTPVIDFKKGKTYDENIKRFKNMINKAFGMKKPTGYSYREKGITNAILTNAYIIEYKPDTQHIILSMEDIPMTPYGKELTEKINCEIHFIFGNSYKNYEDVYNTIPIENRNYKGEEIVSLEDLKLIFEKPKERDEGAAAGGMVSAAGGGEYTGGKRNKKTRRHSKRKHRKNTRKRGKKSKRNKSRRYRNVKRSKQTKRSRK